MGSSRHKPLSPIRTSPSGTLPTQPQRSVVPGVPQKAPKHHSRAPCLRLPCGFEWWPKPLRGHRWQVQWPACLVIHLAICEWHVRSWHRREVPCLEEPVRFCSCSLAWWPLGQMAACPCSVSWHVVGKVKAERTVSRACSRESGMHPCHCCCFFMLSATLWEKKNLLLRTTSK